MIYKLMEIKNKLALILGLVSLILMLVLNTDSSYYIVSAILVGIVVMAIVVSVINYFYRVIVLEKQSKFYVYLKASGVLGLIIVSIFMLIVRIIESIG